MWKHEKIDLVLKSIDNERCKTADSICVKWLAISIFFKMLVSFNEIKNSGIQAG